MIRPMVQIGMAIGMGAVALLPRGVRPMTLDYARGAARIGYVWITVAAITCLAIDVATG
jgi:hypothetical protein